MTKSHSTPEDSSSQLHCPQAARAPVRYSLCSVFAYHAHHEICHGYSVPRSHSMNTSDRPPQAPAKAATHLPFPLAPHVSRSSLSVSQPPICPLTNPQLRSCGTGGMDRLRCLSCAPLSRLGAPRPTTSITVTTVILICTRLLYLSLSPWCEGRGSEERRRSFIITHPLHPPSPRSEYPSPTQPIPTPISHPPSHFPARKSVFSLAHRGIDNTSISDRCWFMT